MEHQIRREGYTILNDEVRNKYGLYARRCLEIVEACKDYPGKISIKKLSHDEPSPEEVNAKDIMRLMRLIAVKGTTLEVRIEGVDEKATDIAMRIHQVLLFDGD